MQKSPTVALPMLSKTRMAVLSARICKPISAMRRADLGSATPLLLPLVLSLFVPLLPSSLKVRSNLTVNSDTPMACRLLPRYAPSGGFSLCRRFKASSISTAWLSGCSRIHSTSQRGSFTPTGIFFSSGLAGLRPEPLRSPPLTMPLPCTVYLPRSRLQHRSRTLRLALLLSQC